jgi:predicted SAM-dependent methyltransferase
MHPFNLGLKKFIKEYVAGKDIIALNLGSGNKDLNENISNVDIFKYDNVDMTTDLLNSPIKDDSVDVIINVDVLEHVPFPEEAVSEFKRILRRRGGFFAVSRLYMGFMLLLMTFPG